MPGASCPCGWAGSPADLARHNAADHPSSGTADYCPECRNSGVCRDMADDGPVAQPCGSCDRGERYTYLGLPPDPRPTPARDPHPVPAFPKATDHYGDDPWAS